MNVSSHTKTGESHADDRSVWSDCDSEATFGSMLAREYFEENPWGYAKRFRFVRELIRTHFVSLPPERLRVLDVGCGNGSFVAMPLAREGYQVVGIDLHLPSIEHARVLAERMPNARFLLKNVREIQEGLFDVVILSEVLEHVSDPKSLLLSSMIHLKRNGIVVVTVPNGYGEFEIDNWLYHKLYLERLMTVGIGIAKRLLRKSSANHARTEVAATDNSDCGHVQFFRLRVLKRLFADCSLNIVRASAGAFLCGPLICYSIARWNKFIEWNVRISDRLPLVCASSWYFALRRIHEEDLQ